MSEHFPIFRLGTQIARQLSSPIASRIKEYAKTHPRFRAVACGGVARAFARFEMACSLWATRAAVAPRGYYSRSTTAKINITDAQALEIGGNLLGEAVLFALLSIIITLEVTRQALKQEAVAAHRASGWLALVLQLEEVRLEVETQSAELARLGAALANLAAPDGGDDRPGGTHLHLPPPLPPADPSFEGEADTLAS